jgi:hypothetical protein
LWPHLPATSQSLSRQYHLLIGLTAAPLLAISPSIWSHHRTSPAISNTPILELCHPIKFSASCAGARSYLVLNRPSSEFSNR